MVCVSPETLYLGWKCLFLGLEETGAVVRYRSSFRVWLQMCLSWCPSYRREGRRALPAAADWQARLLGE